MPQQSLLQSLLAIGIVAFVLLMAYAKFRGKDIKEAFAEVIGLFKRKKDDVQTSLGEVKRRW